jgi:alpha-tubulin suppressor-like RCC1 family protein
VHTYYCEITAAAARPFNLEARYMVIKKLFAAVAALVIAGTISISPAKAVTAPSSNIGGMHKSVCTIVSNGTIECWGDNTSGQLGGGSNATEPVPINYIAGTWQYLFNGGAGDHMCAIKSNGTLWCWGHNDSGQLGNNSTTNAVTPVQVGSDSTWIAGSVGFNSTCAIKSNGTLWCWGDNSYGQLGNGSIDASLVPAQSTQSGVATVSVADEHACAVTTAATLWCWGKGTTGELGDGSHLSSSSPVQVTGSWTAVTAGQTNPEGSPGHTCALQTNSTLWCWGDSWQGHLGNGTTSPSRDTPQAVTGGHAWLTSVQTHDSACGILTDLSIWCWGAQNNGVIGVADAPGANPDPLPLHRTAGGGLPPTDRDSGSRSGALLLLAGALAVAGAGLSLRKGSLAK